MSELKFTVGSNVYNVVEIDGLMRKYDLYGQVTYSDCRIEIEPSLGATRKTNVIIHELLHACLFEAGYDDQDEELVRRLGNVLTQVIGDNFATFDRLLEMEESE
ncbi:ImmA/IrrE family metallo-endopeptidase [Mesobacillus zeae]|uniref:ImmA/IrrE family metallo-endopeptidase n=1 Tax=Mesobacillus zeae TaxID=1917180 RepID=UPI00300B3403